MNYVRFPIVFEKAFSEDFCNKILNTNKDVHFQKALVEMTDDERLDVRKSKVKFISPKWLYDSLNPFFIKANKLGNWNFQFDWFEPAQITNYNKNDFYKWHADDFEKPYSSDHDNVNFRNKIRKLSCSILLTDPSEFKGGSLDFAKSFSREGEITLQKTNVKLNNLGDLIVFPSFIHHRVNPVVEGERTSLVVWALGKTYD